MFPFFKFRKTPKSVLGVDVGASSIKIVELGRQGVGQKLENYGEFKVTQNPSGGIYTDEAFLSSPKNIARAISAVLKEAGIKTKNANFSIPDFSSFFTSIQLPALTKEELPRAVQYAARSYIPMPLSEITLDWSVVEGKISEDVKRPLEVLVAAIPSKIINYYQQIASLAGLNLKVLEAEVFALIKAAIKGADNKITGLIEIGARSTTVSIVDGRTLRASHSFNISGDDITDIYSRVLNVSKERAEDLKIRYGLNPIEGLDNESNQSLREAVLSLVGEILAEVKKISKDYFQKEGREMEKVIMAGNSSYLSGLKGYFAEQLQKEVLLAEPFSGVSHEKILDNILKDIGPGFAIAVGSALKGFE